jgi:hypothetical protein
MKFIIVPLPGVSTQIIKARSYLINRLQKYYSVTAVIIL